MRKTMRRVLSAALSILLTLAFTLSSAAQNVGVGTVTITSDENQWRQLVNEITDEGMVLLQNDRNTLPLTGKKINLLGYCGFYPVYSGSGSGNSASSDKVDFRQSLEAAGFSVNPAPIDEGVYPAEDPNTGIVATIGGLIPLMKQKEAAPSKFRGQASFENLKKYSDTAVIVFGRNGGEGADLTKMLEGGANLGYLSKDGRNYLEISKNEEALLKKATETFDKVVLVLNTCNMLDMEFLKKYPVDAVLWTGLPGATGLKSFGWILNGTVSPSGRIPDTLVYDNDSHVTTYNMRAQSASNKGNGSLVDYAEGIYMGYKWYETAFAEKAKLSRGGKTFDYADFDSVVAYPFGTGLSYTTFQQKLKEVPATLSPDGTVSFQVEVTNTGSRPGKEAVQLYVTAPYTAYDKQHGVEKSAVSLIGIGKTGMLAPGQSQTVTIPVKMENLASYDASYANEGGTKGAYRLDSGTYTFSIRANSHTVLDSANATLAKDHVYTDAQKRTSDCQAAHNQFEDARRGQYLSRKNGFANFNSVLDGKDREVRDLTFQKNPNQYYAAGDQKITKHYVEGIDYAKKGSLTYSDMRGRAYNDPVCDEVVAQMTKQELVRMARWGTFRTAKADSVGHPETLVTDGPSGINSALDSSIKGTSYASIPLLAATFNQDLAKRYGSYIADEAHLQGISGWYAPAVNLHRNSYAGRNYEYYSEDGFLTAAMAAPVVKGATDKGLICYVKHFALNDSETSTMNNLHTYCSEQGIRENYLLPFEACVKEGKTRAVMAACNYVGDRFAPANESLMTEVLRNEWGFQGMTSTDMHGEPIQYRAWYAGDSILRAGTDIWLGLANDLKTISANTDADLYYLQRAAKHVLWTEANAVIIPAGKTHIGWIPTNA